MKKNCLILFSLSAIFFIFGLDIFFIKKVNASNELKAVPELDLNIEEDIILGEDNALKNNSTNIEEDSKPAEKNIQIVDDQEQIKIENAPELLEFESEDNYDILDNDPTNFSNFDNINKAETVIDSGEDLTVKNNNIINEEKSDIIADKPIKNNEFERLLSEALEEDIDEDEAKLDSEIITKKPEEEIDLIEKSGEVKEGIINDNFNKAEIKSETAIDQLDKEEFDIEIIEKELPAIEQVNKEVINKEKVSSNELINEDIEKNNEVQDEVMVSASDKKIMKINAKKKYYISYLNHINHPLFSPIEFDPENPHLDPLVYQEELYQILYAAIIQKNIDVIEATTRKIGVNKEIAVDGMPPIAFAVNEGDIHILSKMLSLGYSPNRFDDNGNSPLHIAILNDRPDMIVELVRFGADITAANAVKIRPLNLAYNLGRDDIIYILEKIGAHNIGDHRSLNSFILDN
ncbi:MAG: ankyrin repeat domain-containing protein [Rickettsiales bacterium]|nr:ankyrin repeat domain-containing protein [Rickettsiales bacterium]